MSFEIFSIFTSPFLEFSYNCTSDHVSAMQIFFLRPHVDSSIYYFPEKDKCVFVSFVGCCFTSINSDIPLTRI